MFNFDDLKSIHMELSTRCQASCPMCARNNHGGLPNPNLKLDDMSLEVFKQIVTQEVLDNVNHFCFCGNFGDPIINDDLIGICQYIKNNSDSNIHIHTNGGARKPEWWQELKNALPEKHCVFFAIDGLEDTHHIYRIGTTYENVTRNAKAFIDAGGVAEWVFIKFKHNEHQAQEARSRAQDLGFTRFTEKNTNRFVGENRFSVVDKDGTHQYYLEPPTDNKMTVITSKEIQQFKDDLPNIEITCFAKKNKEVYIDVHGRLAPCCFIAHAPYNNPISREPVTDIKKQIIAQYFELVEDLGGVDELDLKVRSLKDAIEDQRWQDIWDTYWTEKKLIMCAKSCGNFNVSKPKDQIVDNIIFKQ